MNCPFVIVVLPAAPVPLSMMKSTKSAHGAAEQALTGPISDWPVELLRSIAAVPPSKPDPCVTEEPLTSIDEEMEAAPETDGVKVCLVVWSTYPSVRASAPVTIMCWLLAITLWTPSVSPNVTLKNVAEFPLGIVIVADELPVKLSLPPVTFQFVVESPADCVQFPWKFAVPTVCVHTLLVLLSVKSPVTLSVLDAAIV